MPSFLNAEKPWIVAMITEEEPQICIDKITKAIGDGADAIGIQLDFLKKEYRDEATLRSIFDSCQGLPIYITSYRGKNSEGDTDDQCAELLLLGLKCGATLCDIMGDYYCPTRCQVTFDEEAIAKQKALARKIHELGGEVLFSSHIQDFYEEEDIMRFAWAQIERGADIVKIVSVAETQEQLVKDLKIIKNLKKELPKPFLFLAGGDSCRLIRQMGPNYGVCMYLCTTGENKNQQEVSTIKFLRDEL